MQAAPAYAQAGKRVVVDVDLAKFFDRVNHGILMDRFKKRIDDAGVNRLIRAYLNAGIMRRLPCQGYKLKVEISGLNTLGLNIAGGMSPRDSCGRYSL